MRVRKRSDIPGSTLLIALLIAVLLPVAYMIYLSLTAGQGGARLSSGQYRLLLGDTHLRQRLINSCTLSLKTLTLQLPLSVMGGLALTRCRSRFKTVFTAFLLLMLLLPFQTYMFPLFILFRRYGLYDSHLALILFSAFSPLGPLTVYSFMRAVPEEQWEAASLDTSSLHKTVLHVILPQLKPMLAALTLLCFTEIWNTVEPVVILLRSDALFPASLSLNYDRSVSWAAATVYCAPVLLLYIPAARFIKS